MLPVGGLQDVARAGWGTCAVGLYSPVMANRICRLLGIRYPIFLGGMAHVAREPLVSAVSSAGGLGIIGAGGMSPEELARQIQLVRKATDRPFGVNLMLMDPKVPELIEVVLSAQVPSAGGLLLGSGRPYGGRPECVPPLTGSLWGHFRLPGWGHQG